MTYNGSQSSALHSSERASRYLTKLLMATPGFREMYFREAQFHAEVTQARGILDQVEPHIGPHYARLVTEAFYFKLSGPDFKAAELRRGEVVRKLARFVWGGSL